MKGRTVLPRIPIWQAPTGSIAGPELCAAVCKAGGVGAMALTWTPPEQAALAIRQVREAAPSLPFLVNFALAFSPVALTAALEAGVPIVTFSWGDAGPYIAQAKAGGAKVGIQVTNVAGAQKAKAQGADFLVCQGMEAGGHVQSTTGLWELLPRIVDAADGLPILATGGIADGAGIAKALQLGAAGAMLGTRFVATQESRAHENYKRRLTEASGEDTALTVCFDGSWPYAAHRVLRNATLENWEAAGCPPVGRRPGEGETIGKSADGEPILRYEDTAPRTGFTGDTDAMCCYAGAGVGAISDVPSAAELIERLWAECRVRRTNA